MTTTAKGRPRKFNTDKALDTALKLFWKYGYEGTSISMLSESIGVKTPSLYLAFGNKEALFLQAIERYVEKNGAAFREALAQPTAKEVARSLLEGEVKLVTRRSTPGCLMIHGALAASPESQTVCKRMSEMRREGEKWLAERFRKAAADGDLPQGFAPASMAAMLMAFSTGIAVQAKGGTPKKKLLTMVEIFMRSWPSA